MRTSLSLTRSRISSSGDTGTWADLLEGPRGSNCIAVTPPGLIPFSFGNDSFRPHLAAARARGVEPRILDLPGIGLDIDTPDDLRQLIARGGGTRTHAYLASSGIAARLGEGLRRAGGAVS